MKKVCFHIYLKNVILLDNKEVIYLNKIKQQLEDSGYDFAVAIATQAEIEAGAACGQLASLDD